MVINLASPTGDSDRTLGVWMERGSEPSLGFGPSHTHAEVWAADGACSGHSGSIIDLITAILRDEVVILQEIGGEHPGHQDWLDLRDPASIEEHLTSRYSADRIRLKSWSGRADREVAIEEI